MPRRFKYGFNSQWNNLTQSGFVTPIGYMEVVPGETVSGTTSVQVWSDTTKSAVTNKVFTDLFAFYVPFRLVYDNWPDFIRGRESTNPGLIETLPTVGDLFPFNFEKAFTIGTPGTENANLAFQRRAYNLIHHKFFGFTDRGEDWVKANWDNNVRRVGIYRPSTFHESLITEPLAGLEQTIDVSGGSLAMDDLREALHRDQFNKLKTYYGNRYVDYLAQLGVSSNWSILEEPELIGQAHHTTPMEITNATTEDSPTEPTQYLGSPAGQFKGQHKLSLKRTFCPEHGLIAIMAITRVDLPSSGYQPPWLSHTNQEDFWSPEFEGAQYKEWNPNVWGSISDAAKPFRTRAWEHLKKGFNMTSGEGNDGNKAGYFYNRASDLIQSGYLSADSKTYVAGRPIFEGTFGNVPGTADVAEYSYTADHRLIKYSPIKPHGAMVPLK